MKKIILTLAIASGAFRGSTQNLSIDKVNDLWMTIYQFVTEQHPNFTGHKSSELAFLLFQTNDSGHISSFHIKGDPGDSIFNILNRMPLSKFDKWECKSAANKLIMVPYFYLFWETKSYNAQILELFFRKSPASEIILESGNTIFVKYMMWYSPLEPRPGCPVAEFQIITDSSIRPKPVVEKN